MTIYRKKLIEVALPLDAINKASAREKSIRHGHPSTLHLWWARRPLAAARAVIFAQMVDDPSAHPEMFSTEAELVSLPDEQRQTEREKRISACLDQGEGECHLRDPRIAELVENALLHFDGERYRLLGWCVMPNHVHVMIQTMEGYPLDKVLHSWKSFTAKEANRLLKRTAAFWQPEYHDRYIRDETHFAAALRYIEGNPVKAGLVAAAQDWRWSSAWKGQRAGETPALPAYRGAQGLAEDVRYYGKWMRDEAEKRIGYLYPKIEITAEMAAGSASVSPARPDLAPYVGRKLTVVAWLWARTVKSPNPAFAHVDVPLASTFMLSTKKGKEAYIEPVIEGDGYRFTVKVGKPQDIEAVKSGIKLSRGSNFGLDHSVGQVLNLACQPFGRRGTARRAFFRRSHMAKEKRHGTPCPYRWPMP